MDVALLGFGEAGDKLDQEIDGFLLRAPKPTSTEVVSFLQLYSGAARLEAAQRLVARGVSTTAVSGAMSWLDASGKIKSSTIGGVLTLASAAVSAYHGYRRNSSIGWGAWWFLMGSIFPVFTPVIALAQGLGKKKG